MHKISILTVRAFKVIFPGLFAIFTAIGGYLTYPVLNPWLTEQFLMKFWIKPFEVHETNLNMKLLDRVYSKPCPAEQKAEILNIDFRKMVPGIGMPRAVRTFRIAPDGKVLDENQSTSNPASQEN